MDEKIPNLERVKRECEILPERSKLDNIQYCGAEDITFSIRKSLEKTYVSLFFKEDTPNIALNSSLANSLNDLVQDYENSGSRVYEDPKEREMFEDAFWKEKF